MRIPALSYGHGSQSMLQLGERMMTIIMTLSNSNFFQSIVDVLMFHRSLHTYFVWPLESQFTDIPSLEFGPTPANQTRIVPYRGAAALNPLLPDRQFPPPSDTPTRVLGIFPMKINDMEALQLIEKKCISICYRKFYWKVIFGESSTPRERA